MQKEERRGTKIKRKLNQTQMGSSTREGIEPGESLSARDVASIFLLIAANLVPLAGALIYGWDLASILFVYWAENVIVGFWTFKKLRKIDQAWPEKMRLGKSEADLIYEKATSKMEMPKIFKWMDRIMDSRVNFFVFHYGLFAIVYGVLVFVFFEAWKVVFSAAFLMIASLMISHGTSYVRNFIGREEYKVRDFDRQMLVVYKRVFVLGFVTIFGGALVDFRLFDGSFLVLILLIVVKTVADLFLHLRFHKIVGKAG